MTTGARAVERIAEATGFPMATVDTASRVLKQHQPPLWPLAGQGGGKRAKHVEPEHLVNMALTLAWADPISNAPAIVTRVRGLVERRAPTRTSRHQLSQNVVAYAVAEIPQNRLTMLAEALRRGPATLGETLDFYVRALATLPDVREKMRSEELSVELGTWPYEFATITRRDEDGTVSSNFDGLGLLTDIPPDSPPATMRRTVTLPFALFEVLADLYADTLSRKQSALPLPPSDPVLTTAGDEETENAGPTTGPALIRNQDRDLSDPAPSQGQPEANGGERQSQAPSRGPGRSTNRHRSRHNGRAADSPPPAAA